MRIATPDGLFSWTYTIQDHPQGPTLAIVELKTLQAKGTITIDGVEYRFKQTDWMAKRIVLTFEGVELARATRKSVWTQKIRITFADGGLPGTALRLVPLGTFQAGFRVEEEEGARIGRVEHSGLLRRDLRIHLPESMPLPLQGFLTALTMADLRRRQSN